MTRQSRTFAAILVLALTACDLALAQAPATTELIIDVENVVYYQSDTPDITKLARNTDITPAIGIGVLPTQTPNFTLNTGIGDIVAVNGQPAKGLFASRSRGMGTTRSVTPGRGIADIIRAAMREDIFEILQPDGTHIGSIMIFGMSGGDAPPGRPSGENGNWAIVGGTGAFLGARGQAQEAGGNIPGRIASMVEDPAYRRVNRGGTRRFVLHLVPMNAPRIVTGPRGPAVVHSRDFASVTAGNPAAPGEILSLIASGLGPTIPGVAPGQYFPSAPLAVVSSPVIVTVNGRPAEVLAAVGYPSSYDAYQVNFRVPHDVEKGNVDIQLAVAWIADTPVTILVQ